MHLLSRRTRLPHLRTSQRYVFSPMAAAASKWAEAEAAEWAALVAEATAAVVEIAATRLASW